MWLVELLILDIDECREHPGICSYKCQNTDGDFDCICPPGEKCLTFQFYTVIVTKRMTHNLFFSIDILPILILLIFFN
jgi:hypothetical protein